MHQLTIFALVCVAAYVGFNGQLTRLLAAPDADIDIPLTSGPSLTSVPVVLDLDGDGPQEIVLASEGGILSLISGKTNQVLWTKNLAEYLKGYSNVHVEAGLAAGDLDNDGKIEVVIATGGRPVTSAKPGAIIVLTYVGGATPFALRAGWPRYGFDELGGSSGGNQPDGAPDGFLSTPAIGDIDGDGQKEIVIGGMDRRIHAWHADGSDVLGWPIDRTKNLTRDNISSPALADLDNDGKAEVIIGTNSFRVCPNPYLFVVLKGDGTFYPGWPVETTDNIASSPAVGDLDGDGFLDIVVGTGNYDEHCQQAADGNKVYAWDRNGQPLPGWPRPTAGNMETSPAIGDIDGDNKLDVVIGCHDYNNRACNTLYGWHGDGSALAGWPVQSLHPDYPSTFDVWDSTRLADIDGDGAVEVLAADALDVIVIKPNGTIEQPAKRTTHLYHPPGLTITDIDHDGLLETIVIGKNEANGLGIVHIWQETGSATGNVPWPTFHRDMQRSGLQLPLSSISGRVTDKAGAGVANVTISAGPKSVVTDQNGNYTLANLLSGAYTVQPSSPNQSFEPAARTITIPPAATDQNFVQRADLIHGYVQQSNGIAFKGAPLKLSNGAQTSSDENGYYEFSDLNRQTYTVTPDKSDLRFVPGEQTVKLPDLAFYDFIVLAAPVSKTFSKPNDAALRYEDTQGLPTSFDVPTTRTINVTLAVTPTLPPAPDQDIFTGHAFQLTMRDNRTGEVAQSHVVINYSDADLRIITESGLALKVWTGQNWQTLLARCPNANPTLNTETNTFSADLCDEGLFALFGPTQRVFLPLVKR
ncbi:MAG: FG-GAP-like repeat-containing protein [Chloroflexi bacterium]|nr:FG-GAP-like repeat-containing protein [Chloroflexota bacterium]